MQDGIKRDPVKIRVANQKGYLWDLNDIQYLRVQHHIVGVLQGTLPQVTQQNVFLGLPLVLLPEEVVLLVKHSIAILIDDPKAHLEPTKEQSDTYNDLRGKAIEVQRKMTVDFEKGRKEEFERINRDKIQRSKLIKENKRKEKQKAVEGEGEGFELFVPDIERGEQTTGKPLAAVDDSSRTTTTTTTTTSTMIPPTPPQEPSSLSSVPYTIVIDPTSSRYPWYDPSSSPDNIVSYSTLSSARSANVWNYPTNKLQESRCRVFEDLWKQGYYMGGGLRFGGDFLVYPGDPLRYHSHFTLTILSTPSTSISPLDLVAYGRLATAVKKSHLLASWDDEVERVRYLSLEWAAFG